MKSKAPGFCRRNKRTKPRDVGRFDDEDVHRFTRSRPPSMIFVGGGEMGERIRNFNWSKTPLGPIEQWPQSLVTSVQIMLASRRPVWVGWGVELINLYNDHYKAIIGRRHPSALGKPMREVLPELWDQLDPLLQRAIGGTQGIYVEEQLLIMQRHGFKEETYYTYSYTPVPNEGGIGGIICASTEDTLRVIGQRRISLVQQLGACGTAKNAEEVCHRVKSALATNSKDLPFVLLYLLDASGQRLVLRCSVGFSGDHPAAPASMPVSDDAPWPAAQVLKSNSPRLVDLAHYSNLPRGSWPQSPDKAVVLPLAGAADGERNGVIIVGLNPFRQFNEPYQSFLSFVVSQITASVNHARAYDAERKSLEREQAARRDAENAMRVKDRFLAMLSHELRTPLNPVLLIASDAVTDPDLPPNIREEFEVILKNVEVEAQLIDELLDISRITHGKLNLKMRAVDAHRVLEDALQTVQDQIQYKQIRATVELKAEEHSISADPVRLQQIFWNILRNAVKFTPEHGKISIETFLTEDKSRIDLMVTDSGIGMTPEELSNAFSAFAQGEHTGDWSANYGGLGLGLAISKRLVELHRGSIQAMSDGRGHGATFTIEFPVLH